MSFLAHVLRIIIDKSLDWVKSSHLLVRQQVNIAVVHRQRLFVLRLFRRPLFSLHASRSSDKLPLEVDTFGIQSWCLLLWKRRNPCISSLFLEDNLLPVDVNASSWFGRKLSRMEVTTRSNGNNKAMPVVSNRCRFILSGPFTISLFLDFHLLC